MNDFNPVYAVTDPASPTSGSHIRKPGVPDHLRSRDSEQEPAEG